ncbi:tetratricopeptide repeat protein [filamentous cyanobacterium LEGE 11480]|uniref:Tetratricopeptide repeat protein n=2 Tax=Romeriopsis TaxID=2992131 RepID=A0A928VPG3_9CYAN|nr:tetratricopeptide repeat protein [Romeriopsis navalis LEGE 11480]
MQLSIARQLFMREVRQPDEYIDLERAALYMAQEAYPTLDMEEYVVALDGMAEEIRARLPVEDYPLRTLKVVNQYLYEELGFKPNQADYYSAKNSFLNDVLDRRTGIPITMSLVYLSLAQRIAFPMVGIGLPGHFLIRPVQNDMEIFVDAFNYGEILFAQDCADLLRKMFGDQLAMQEQFLAPVSNGHFLARMLTNLKAIYAAEANVEGVLAAVERILLIFPEAPIELRDRGMILFRLNRWVEAREDLERYLTVHPVADDRHHVQNVLEHMQNTRLDS